MCSSGLRAVVVDLTLSLFTTHANQPTTLSIDCDENVNHVAVSKIDKCFSASQKENSASGVVCLYIYLSTTYAGFKVFVEFKRFDRVFLLCIVSVYILLQINLSLYVAYSEAFDR